MVVLVVILTTKANVSCEFGKFFGSSDDLDEVNTEEAWGLHCGEKSKPLWNKFVYGVRAYGIVPGRCF